MKTATFACHSSTLPFWTHDRKLLQHNAYPSRDRTLTILEVELANNGYYECMGTTSNGFNFAARALLLVLRKLTFQVFNYASFFINFVNLPSLIIIILVPTTLQM